MKRKRPRQLDVSAIAHTPNLPARRIVQRWQPFGIRTTAGAILLRRRSLAQRFVRALLVVAGHPPRRTPLHRPAMRSSRRHHLALIAAMKLFVSRVVARSRPPSELDADAQTQPPHREARKPQGALAAK